MRRRIRRTALFAALGFAYGLILAFLAWVIWPFEWFPYYEPYHLELPLTGVFSSPIVSSDGRVVFLGMIAQWTLIGVLLAWAGNRWVRIFLILAVSAHYSGFLLLLPNQPYSNWPPLVSKWEREPAAITASLAVYLVGQLGVWLTLVRGVWRSSRTEPQRTWRQFGLTTLLLLPVMVAMPLGWLAVEVRQAGDREVAVAAYEHLEGELEFELLTAPAWIRRLGGEYFLAYAPWFEYHSSDLTDDDLVHVGRLRELLYLDISQTQITDVGIAHLENLTLLQDLRLSGTQTTDGGLAHLGDMTLVQTFDLSGTRIKGPGLLHLKRMSRLDILDLRNTEVDDDSLAHLTGLRRLSILDLADTPVSDEGLRHLGRMECLISLNLDGTQVTDVGLQWLSRCVSLQGLSLAGTRITDAGLRHLATPDNPQEFSSLMELDLSRTRITDVGLEFIAREIGPADLYLGETDVTDAGLAHLQACAGLRLLSLEGTAITDAGLDQLHDLPHLSEVRVANTKVTQEGIDRLHKAWQSRGMMY